MILDFFIYYVTFWFERNKNKLVRSTPIQRCCYMVGIATLTFFWTIEQILHFTLLKDLNYQVPKILLILLAVGFMYLYQFIYIKKKRYEAIEPSKFRLLKNISEGNRAVISLVFVAISILSPMFIFMFFSPFGEHKLHGRSM
jgi:hypothetical protein